MSSSSNSPNPSRFSLPTVRAVARLLDEAGLSEITIETNDATQPERLVVRREVVGVATSEAALQAIKGATVEAEGATGQSAPSTESNLVLVPSPTVGFFHHTEKPVGEGANVRAGQTIGLVTTLAIPNDVTAPVDGRIVEIRVAEGQGVAFGQELFVIEKSSPRE